MRLGRVDVATATAVAVTAGHSHRVDLAHQRLELRWHGFDQDGCLGWCLSCLHGVLQVQVDERDLKANVLASWFSFYHISIDLVKLLPMPGQVFLTANGCLQVCDRAFQSSPSSACPVQTFS